MKTLATKLSDIKKQWFLIDADGVVLGRLASYVASRLRGKHKPTFSPNIDCGDNIVVVNSKKIVMTGNKFNKKIHYRHTGYPGGIKEESYGSILDGKKPEKIISMAVRRMMPKGVLARQQLRKLHIYSSKDHPHVAQNPTTIDLAKLNSKNTKESKFDK